MEKGAHHLLKQVKLIREAEFLTEEEKKKMNAVVKNNSYYAHPHMVLLAMLGEVNPNFK